MKPIGAEKQRQKQRWKRREKGKAIKNETKGGKGNKKLKHKNATHANKKK
jgi:hypothetical protein